MSLKVNCFIFKVLCTADVGNGKEMDLSPLIKSSGHHLVLPSSSEALGETFYINVCEPLNPIYGVLCPPGASACSVKQGRQPEVCKMKYTFCLFFVFF